MLSLRIWLIVVSRSSFLCIHSAFQAFLKHTQRQFPNAQSIISSVQNLHQGLGTFRKVTLDPLYTFSGAGVWAFDGKRYVDSLLNGLRDLLHCLQLADCLAAYT